MHDQKVPEAANLCELLGPAVCLRMLAKAGGLTRLSQLGATPLRLLGIEDVLATPDAAPSSSYLRASLVTHSDGQVAHDGASQAKLLQAGYILAAPLFHDSFGGEDASAQEVPTQYLQAARKALVLLARKVALAAKADMAGGAADGAFGRRQYEELRDTFARLRAEGKVLEVDRQALPMPVVRRRGESPKRRRGGVAAHQKRLRQAEPVSVVTRALSRIKMGVSEEAQRETVLQSTEVRAGLMQERDRALQQAERRRPHHTRQTDEYDDLMTITL